MNEYVTNELIENTYLFCVKRIFDREAAMDLSQDILYEALRAIAGGKQFECFHSWYWRMARNKYADYVSYKQNPALPIEETIEIVSELREPLEEVIKEEDISELNLALSRLTSLYREIIIRFYLKEQSVAKIAAELNLPEGTVKRRLFDAKKSVKERMDNMNKVGTSAYAPAQVNWFWGYDMRKASEVYDNQVMARQISVLCRKDAKTVSELADEMGVATVYLEQMIADMVKVDLLSVPAKGKYLTNFCMFPEQEYDKAKALMSKVFWEKEFPKKVTEVLLGLKDKLTALDFFGKHMDYKYLMWILLVKAGDRIGEYAVKHYLEKYEGKISKENRKYYITATYLLPEEKQEENEADEVKEALWSNLHRAYRTAKYGRLEYVNDFEYKPFPVNWGDEDGEGRDEWVDGNNITLLMKLATNPKKRLTGSEEEMAAEFIRKGILKKTKEGLEVQLPIFKRKVWNELLKIVEEGVGEIAKEYADLVGEQVEKILLPYVRKDLMSNFVYWNMQMLFQPIGYLVYYGMKESDCLSIPEDYARSAAGLYIIRG